jgi:hypothetical protein
MCPEWRASFLVFLRDMGPRPSPKHSIDRIDNGKGYEPGNVRWATWSEQMSNRECCLPLIEIEGMKRSLRAWSKLYGMRWATVYKRIRKGWDPVRALTTPLDPRGGQNRKFDKVPA